MVAVKVRVGFGLGTRSFTNRPETFDPFVDALERLGFDSLWLSERITGDAPDPVVGMAYAAGRTTRLKFGTSVLVLPGRNPVVLAKALASLDRLSNGRLLPAFGLGVVDPREQQAFGVTRKERAPIFDEALPLMRRLWQEDVVDHHGGHFHLDAASVLPKPAQRPLEVWLGGQAPSELRRVGRLGDGWLPSFCDAEDVRTGKVAIEEAAEAAGRAIDPEHWGALVAYRRGPLPDALAAFIAKRRPDGDPDDLVPEGTDGLRRRLEELIDVGASKFVPLLLGEPPDWDEELEDVATAVLPLQT
jgi:probable F420-dependent oxidoreductase